MAPLSETEKADLAKALALVNTYGQKLLNGGDADGGPKDELLASARDLIFTAQDPVDTLLWHIWGEQTRPAVARTAVDLKLFETVTSDNGRPKILWELASPTNASPQLVQRIARACVAMRWMDMQGPNLYVPNKVTRALVQPGGMEGIIFCFESHMPSITKFPEFLRNSGFRNPESGKGPFQYGHGIDKSIFHWMTEDRPEVFAAFHKYIYSIRAHRPRWLDIYPADEQLAAGLSVATQDSTAFVDIGGSMALDLEEFWARVPEYSGRLILQEIPTVIGALRSSGRVNPRIELQEHDFFTPQPVKGARAYFMRMVLHDWSDEAARKILGHLRDAMTPRYSKLLIAEAVVSNEKPAWHHAALDISMMSLAGAMERTEREWKELVEGCGLRVEKIWSEGVGNESLIEVMRME